jgi:hypothetical protein
VLIGATILCFLVMLVLVADRLGAHVFHGDADRIFYRCEVCDLRYPRRELNDPRRQVCPSGHPVALEQRGVAAGLVGICICLGFLCAATVLIISGVVR